MVVPAAGQHLSLIFWELDGYRASSTAQIPPQVVESWLRLRGMTLELWELEALQNMDSARTLGPEYSDKAVQEAAAPPISAELFDRMLG